MFKFAAMESGRPPASSTSAVPGADRNRAGRRALVVESDPDTRQLVQEILTGLGFIVDAVDNGVDAVSTARQRPPEVILVALQLRDVGGLEVLRWLRANSGLKRVPVIAVGVNEYDLARVRHAQIRAVLRKPLSSSAIVEAIEAAMSVSG
ncbi:MAG TPA: response regulator [Stellaceae bacterium]|nr:response regulator [Stellaceae bacterium]